MTDQNSLGQILLARGQLDAATLQSALKLQQQQDAAGIAARNNRLGALLVRLGALSEESLLSALSAQLGCPVVSEDLLTEITPAAIEFHTQIPQALAEYLGFFAAKIPLARIQGTLPKQQKEQPLSTQSSQPSQAATPEVVLCVASKDVLNSSLQEYLDSQFPVPRQMLLVSGRDLERTLKRLYHADQNELQSMQTDLRRLAEDAPVIEQVNSMLARATDLRASDVHIEPEDIGFVVRYRIDGRLQSSEQHGRERFDAIVSRIKLISGLDIAERRLPQDGRFTSRTAGVKTDVRVSVIPGVHGESLVLRLLPNMQGKRFELESLGFEADHLRLYRSWLTQPDGIILVTGPTGSGKSTTLYATLADCDTEHERILTVEDPVEYRVAGVTQFQVQSDIGFDFPAALRSILRHDPDTVMIGEIRDTETARIAVQASLTGHRVFSTLHTNDSASAFLRLSDMGIENFLIGATVRGVIAQRLLRRLCLHCARDMSSSLLPTGVEAELERMGIVAAEAHFKQPQGCAECNDSGYRGRIAIYEFLSATPSLRAALSRSRSTPDDLFAAAEPGFRSLRGDGLIKAARGVTSLAEVYGITGGEYSAPPIPATGQSGQPSKLEVAI